WISAGVIPSPWGWRQMWPVAGWSEARSGNRLELSVWGGCRRGGRSRRVPLRPRAGDGPHPVEVAALPDVRETDQQDPEEDQDVEEPGPGQAVGRGTGHDIVCRQRASRMVEQSFAELCAGHSGQAMVEELRRFAVNRRPGKEKRNF